MRAERPATVFCSQYLLRNRVRVDFPGDSLICVSTRVPLRQRSPRYHENEKPGLAPRFLYPSDPSLGDRYGPESCRRGGRLLNGRK